MADYLDPVVVELEGRDRKLLDTLTRAKAEVRRFAADVGRMNATIKVDAKLKDGALAEIRRRVADGPAAKLKVDLQLGAGQRDQLRAQLEGRPITANVRPAMDQTALRRVQVVLRELGRRIDVQIRPQMDQGTQARVQTRLDRLSRDRTVTIRTRVTGDTNRLPGGGGEAGGGGALSGLLTLAPALVPVAAEAAAVAAAVGAATVAVGAFGAAVKPQLSALSNAADAQKKYNDAVAKYGAGSKQAATAQQELTQTFDGMPAATRRAAGAFLALKSDFTSWSNSLARFTMVPVTQGISVLDAILPKLSPLVKDTSAQFTRLTTALAGGVNSGAFDGLMSRFTAFANGVLKGAVNEVIHFSRVLSQGGGSGAFQQFMAYAKANAPLVRDTLKNLSEAILNILKAASQAGPGMLTLVNALAKLVAALPPSVIASMMQVAAAMKAISLTRTGITAVSGPVGTLRTRLTELRAAAAAAGGGLAGLRAAFNSLGTGAKLGVAAAGVTALVMAMHELSDNKGPVAVDQLSTSLNTLASTGKVTGALKTNFTDISESIAMLTKGASDNKIVQLTSDFGTFVGISTGPGVSTARKNLDAWDKSMAQMVSSGHAKEAAAQYDILKRAWVAGGGDLKRLNKFTDDYQSALADQKFEAKLAADSMGLFGQAAQKTQQQLDAQKQSADGLRQSIQALNDTNRSALDGQIGFQAAIAAAGDALKQNGRALSMHNGQLDLSSEKARNEAQALSDLAAKTEDNAAAARDSGASWQKVSGIYSEGRSNLIKVAQQMGLTKSQAKQLADQILNIDDLKKVKVQMDTEDAKAGLSAFNAAVRATPGSKSVTLKALSSAAEQVLQTFGYHVQHLKDGSVKITAATGGALSQIRNVQGAVNSLRGKTVTITTRYVNELAKPGQSVHDVVGATGGRFTGKKFRYAGGGKVSGPGTGTSDDVFAPWLSNGEFVIKKASVDKYGERLFQLLNSGRLAMPHFSSGGRVKLTSAEKDARGQLSGSFGISSFGRMAGYQRTPFEHSLAAPADINSLVDALNGFRGEIKKAFSGKTESSLLRQLDKAGKSLISYDKQLTRVTASLASAKTKLDDLKSSAAELKSSVASSIMQGASVVTQAPQEGFALSGIDVVNNMNAQLQKASAFSAQLQQLKKRGLSADLLDQIAEAGVDQGGATAAALAGASNAQLKQLNSMQSQLKKSANAAGSAVSDSMYGAGIKAAEGLVKGLEKKQKSIEAAMLRIAKSMEGAIKKALRIKSPSQVMADLGDYTALGLAHGITRSSKHAVIAARGMAMSVAHGAALAGSPTWAGAPTGGGRGGGMVVHNHFHFQIEGSVKTIDGLAKDVEAAFLRRGMRNPLTYPQYKR